jgi:hypothetical protein
MDMYVYEPGRGDFVCGNDFLGPYGQSQGTAWNHCFNHTVTQENTSIEKFGSGSEGAAYMEKGRSHK